MNKTDKIKINKLKNEIRSQIGEYQEQGNVEKRLAMIESLDFVEKYFPSEIS